MTSVIPDRTLVAVLLLVAAFATWVGHGIDAPHLVAAGRAGVLLGFALALSIVLSPRRRPARRRKGGR